MASSSPKVYKVKVKDAAGNCCCSGTCSILCSTRGGTATLIGLSEYTDVPHGINASLPPKKYRTLTLSGQTYMYESSTGSCPIPVDDGNGSQTQIYSGGITYSKTTGLILSNNGNVRTIDTGCYGASDSNTPVSGILSAARIPNTVTSTVQTQGKGIGCNLGICGGGTLLNYADPAKIATAQLTDEDTEVDAINRAGVLWSDYALCSGDCCYTTRQIRGAGQFSFTYIESRFKLRGTSPLKNATIVVQVDSYRRVFGVGLYAKYQTLEFSPPTDAQGLWELDGGVIANDAGYETILRNCRVVS